MQRFFEVLPRELREKVYHELLVDDIDGVEPQGMYSEDKTTDKKLYVEILRVCKQAYMEASSTLYEQNLFRYEYRHLCVKLGGKSLFPGWVPPKGRFERIQHLEIAYRPSVQSGEAHLCAKAQEITVVANHIMDLGPRPKTLRLAFILPDLGPEDPWDPEDPGTKVAQRIARSKDLVKAVAAIDVGTEIEVFADSYTADHELMFARFAEALGSAKDCGVSKETPDPAAASGRFRWTWTICLAPAMRC